MDVTFGGLAFGGLRNHRLSFFEIHVTRWLVDNAAALKYALSQIFV